VTPEGGRTPGSIPGFVGYPVLPKDRDVQGPSLPRDGVGPRGPLDGRDHRLEDRPEGMSSTTPGCIPRRAKPSGVHRLEGVRAGAAPKKIAELGPAARSFSDLSTKPRKTYLYWVTLKGLEDRSVRTTTATLVQVTNQAERPGIGGRPPVDTRPQAGRRRQDPCRAQVGKPMTGAKKAWIPRTVLTAPGEMVAGTGWSLKSLRFDDFTLVADVTDDDGVGSRPVHERLKEPLWPKPRKSIRR